MATKEVQQGKCYFLSTSETFNLEGSRVDRSTSDLYNNTNEVDEGVDNKNDAGSY